MVHVDLNTRGFRGLVAERGAKAPIQADGRRVVERTNSWMNDFGKLHRCTERRKTPVEFFIAMASAAVRQCGSAAVRQCGSAIITVGCLIRREWIVHRWDTCPRSPRIR
nr:hypothetical protein HEP87_00130 [Streptomyces sp. S1D4-11]